MEKIPHLLGWLNTASLYSRDLSGEGFLNPSMFALMPLEDILRLYKEVRQFEASVEEVEGQPLKLLLKGGCDFMRYTP